MEMLVIVKKGKSRSARENGEYRFFEVITRLLMDIILPGVITLKYFVCHAAASGGVKRDTSLS